MKRKRFTEELITFALRQAADNLLGGENIPPLRWKAIIQTDGHLRGGGGGFPGGFF